MPFELRPRDRREGNSALYMVGDIINALNAVDALIATPDGQRALDAVAAAFGLRRVHVDAPWPPRVVVIEAPGREVTR